MKTKLLKKVRKEFEIIHHIKITDPNDSFYGETPIFEVVDSKSCGLFNRGYYNYHEAHKYLIKLIRKYYYKTKKIDRSKSKKVWYNEKR